MNRALLNKHLELVRAANTADSERQRAQAMQRLDGFRDAVALVDLLDEHKIECDLYYLHRFENRPMDGGVFLDWSPAI